MNLRLLHTALILSCLSTSHAGDWPCWRGANHDGIADASQRPPTSFSATENVHWVIPVAGRGHGSPTVLGNRVFLAVADTSTETQAVLCVDRDSGKKLWETVVHRGGFEKRMNEKATHASSTPACDGERVFINFLNSGAVFTTALDLDGKQLWQQKICDYTVHQGYGSSPAIYKSLVIVSADNKAGGAIRAFARSDGKPVWKIDRPKFPNYASPIVHTIGGRDQLVIQGCELVSSFDPMTGEKIWEFEGATTECVSSLVTDGERLFTSGGYPKNHVAAVAADGSGKIVWEDTTRVYVPSMLVKDGYLFAVMDSGNAICWDSATGEEMWKERLARTTSGSPVLVGDQIYSIDETGQFFVFAADPKQFKIIAQNKLGDECLSTPTICGGQIFVRVAENIGDRRQEKLYCIGNSAQ